ncbi:MAG: carboxypeptidase regulatory-like domain-containing protein, partial [Acidobacteria bacterium]|nr:carboxypeptidase regulatory-like domain-containing protein [Acidobacteriota bacterium]
MLQKFSMSFATLMAMVIGSAGPALAQGGAAGVVGQGTDGGGLAVPGVTVTASSPALQVREVTTVTDERGEYRLTPLPIGSYTVTYALTGFHTVKREDVRLGTGFVATVNVKMELGGLEETITVSGASPTVDVTSTATTTRITRETLELLP